MNHTTPTKTRKPVFYSLLPRIFQGFPIFVLKIDNHNSKNWESFWFQRWRHLHDYGFTDFPNYCNFPSYTVPKPKERHLSKNILAVTSFYVELDKCFIKGKMWGKHTFYSEIFLISQKFEVWARYGQKLDYWGTRLRLLISLFRGLTQV